MTDPVIYSVTVAHWHDGEIDVQVHGVGDSEQDRKSIAQALRQAADLIERGEPRRKADLS